MLKLHLGCGAILKEGWINIDFDSKEEIAKRYLYTFEEAEKLKSLPEIFNYDIFDLPYETGTVDEILCEAVIEHLDFHQESKFFHECARVLKVGGKLTVSTDDFDELVRLWSSATDDFVSFYRGDRQNDWFGQGNKNFDNKWGYLTACFFGNQSSKGQYHKNAYTEKKLRKVYELVGLEVQEVSREKYKNEWDPMIRVSGVKVRA